MIYDAIVIGVGGMGSAALCHLARRGLKVLGLEQFEVAHERGSSHGLSRIIRLAYAEDPRYVPLLRRAYALWRELEAATGERLLTITGGVDIGSEDGATVRGSLASCRMHDLAHEHLDAAGVSRRFPGYRLPEDMAAVYQPDAGILAPERCVAAHAALARKHGAELHLHERVVRWAPEDGGVSVRTDRGEYRARKAVISAGAWARRLVPALQALAVPERQVVLWTQPLEPARFAVGAFPIFNMETAAGRFYGFPALADQGFKIGKYHHRCERVEDPDAMDRACHAEDEALLRAAIECYFPSAAGPTLALQTCLFTNSPDEHFLIDALADAPQVSIAGAFSGHGFKFCSVVGEILADLVADGGSRFDIGMFGLDRFEA